MVVTSSGTAGNIVVDTNLTTATSITIAAEPPSLPAIPERGRTVQRAWRYVDRCLCPECIALRDGRLYWRNDHTLVPASTLMRSAPHEYAKAPPEPNTDAWRERSARGSKLLRGLLVGKQLRVWDRFNSLIIRYKKGEADGHCTCDDCDDGRMPIAGLLLAPEPVREFGRWEFDEGGRLIHKRNIWALDGDTWSYEDELISLLLSYRSAPKDFCETGCRDRAGYYSERDSYLRAHRIMRRVTRFPDATNVAPFARADQPGMFAGNF